MGTSFANLQIRSSNIEMVEKCIKKIKTDEFSSNSISNQLHSLLMNSYYVSTNNEGWITLLQDNFGWESIREDATEISKVCDAPILAVGYCDESILEITLVKQGKVVTSFLSGYLEVYGLEESYLNIEVFCEVLGIDPIKISDIFSNNTEVEEIVQQLEKVLDITMWINADWLDDLDEDEKSKFRKI